MATTAATILHVPLMDPSSLIAMPAAAPLEGRNALDAVGASHGPSAVLSRVPATHRCESGSEALLAASPLGVGWEHPVDCAVLRPFLGSCEAHPASPFPVQVNLSSEKRLLFKQDPWNQDLVKSSLSSPGLSIAQPQNVQEIVGKLGWQTSTK